MGELFEVLTSKKRFDANKVQVFQDGKNPYVVRTSSNNGQRGFIVEDESYLNEGNTISFGQDTATMFYQEKPYFTGDKIKVLKAKNKKFNKNNAQFFISTMAKAFSTFSWGSSSFNVNIIENQKLTLPTQNGEIDFAFMENFIAELEAERIAELEAERIAELEAYLQATGLQDYTLTKEEEKALQVFEGVMFEEFTYQNIFNKIIQGRRLRKEDQISGTIPFVMAGTTNTGVVNYISNPVASFPKNSITIDIFGNTFYRNYDFGAGDDTGVYWNDEKEYSKEIMLFCATAMEKSLFGKFSFGKKLRSSQSVDFKMFLPSTQGVPLYAYMEVFIRAVQKLVIKEVVQYADRKITATREVVTKS